MTVSLVPAEKVLFLEFQHLRKQIAFDTICCIFLAREASLVGAGVLGNLTSPLFQVAKKLRELYDFVSAPYIFEQEALRLTPQEYVQSLRVFFFLYLDGCIACCMHHTHLQRVTNT